MLKQLTSLQMDEDRGREAIQDAQQTEWDTVRLLVDEGKARSRVENGERGDFDGILAVRDTGYNSSVRYYMERAKQALTDVLAKVEREALLDHDDALRAKDVEIAMLRRLVNEKEADFKEFKAAFDAEKNLLLSRLVEKDLEAAKQTESMATLKAKTQQEINRIQSARDKEVSALREKVMEQDISHRSIVAELENGLKSKVAALEATVISQLDNITQLTAQIKVAEGQNAALQGGSHREICKTSAEMTAWAEEETRKLISRPSVTLKELTELYLNNVRRRNAFFERGLLPELEKSGSRTNEEKCCKMLIDLRDAFNVKWHEFERNVFSIDKRFGLLKLLATAEFRIDREDFGCLEDGYLRRHADLIERVKTKKWLMGSTKAEALLEIERSKNVCMTSSAVKRIRSVHPVSTSCYDQYLSNSCYLSELGARVLKGFLNSKTYRLLIELKKSVDDFEVNKHRTDPEYLTRTTEILNKLDQDIENINRDIESEVTAIHHALPNLSPAEKEKTMFILESFDSIDPYIKKMEIPGMHRVTFVEEKLVINMGGKEGRQQAPFNCTSPSNKVH
eukprot:TRINITY_DN12139_c0_g1_i1.p1 TRINITY_DN12139_c0_g1~~TRINITY_DN12139_c0_g1_i1.p1  ORF type:complete len:566 (+),score=96.53 TRINITY_DN12139_c0_g1_i1:46-1743(+)